MRVRELLQAQHGGLQDEQSQGIFVRSSQLGKVVCGYRLGCEVKGLGLG